MRWLTIVAALCALTLAVAGAGCGGGDDEASDDTGITITDETTTDETTDETTTDTGTDTDFNFASEDCQGLVAAYLALGSAFAAASAGGTDVTDQVEAFEQFADDVPEEIRADVQILADAYSSYAEALADIGLNPGEIPTADQLQQIQDAAASLGPEVTAASERLDAWTTENC